MLPAIFAPNKSTIIDKQNDIKLIVVCFPESWLIFDETYGCFVVKHFLRWPFWKILVHVFQIMVLIDQQLYSFILPVRFFHLESHSNGLF